MLILCPVQLERVEYPGAVHEHLFCVYCICICHLRVHWNDRVRVKDWVRVEDWVGENY